MDPRAICKSHRYINSGIRDLQDEEMKMLRLVTLMERVIPLNVISSDLRQTTKC